VLSRKLPYKFMGYSAHFGEPDEEGVRLRQEKTSGTVDHMVEVHTIRRFFASQIGLNPHEELGPIDWLTVPEQKLLEVSAGCVYHDGLGELEAVRARLAYYPRDVWLYLLSAQWRRIGELEAFVGRARFAAAIDAAITNPEIRSIPIEAGSVDQITDNADVLGRPEAYGRLRALFR
jgi:hypothetical protein